MNLKDVHNKFVQCSYSKKIYAYVLLIKLLICEFLNDLAFGEYQFTERMSMNLETNSTSARTFFKHFSFFCQLWPKRLVLYSCLCWCLVFPACRAVQGPGCRGWWRNHNCRGYRRQSAGCCWQTAHKRWEPDHFFSSNSRLKDSHCKDKIVVGLSFVYNGNAYSDKTASLYWNFPQDLQNYLLVIHLMGA